MLQLTIGDVHPMKSCNPFITILLLVVLGAACAPATEIPATPTPIIQTVEVTSEVTRLVNVPVTSTPTSTPTLAYTYTPSLTPTITRTPSITPTPEAPLVSILVHSACLYGPGPVYLWKYGLNATAWMRVIGRNEDGSWLAVKAGGELDSNACWIKATLVKFLSGNVRDVPVLWIGLPYSVLYLPPKVVTASRDGNEVTIFWQPIWMTEDDYRGYLVEAWVCQDGKQVFQPLGYVTDVYENETMRMAGSPITVKVTDEPGCDVPSRARLYAVEKHGYTNYVMVPWPAFDPAPTATP